MKGSTNAKPQLLLPVITGEQAHILAHEPCPRPFVSVTQQVRQDTVTLGPAGQSQTGFSPSGVRSLSNPLCVLFLLPTLSFAVIHTRKELTIATVDALGSGWNNELPSKIPTRTWHTVTDHREAVPERAVCHQWTARPSSWSVLSGTNKLFSTPQNSLIMFHPTSFTTKYQYCTSGWGQAVRSHSMRRPSAWGEAEPRRVLWCEMIPQNSSHHCFTWKCVRRSWKSAVEHSSPLFRGKKLF